MKLLRPLIAFFKRLRRDSYQDPARDWLLLISLAFIALTVLVVWDAWVFDTAATGGVIGGKTATTTQLFDTDALNAIRGVFDSRADEEAKYVTGVYRFIDPSQP